MLPVLLVLFTVVPLVELWLLIRIGQAISWPGTILLVIATGVIGAALARYEGLRTLRNVQSAIHSGETPTDQMIGGVLILIAGMVLITPGVITDAIGFLMLIPPVRMLVVRRLRRYFASRTTVSFSGFSTHGPSGPPASDDVIDVEFRDVTDERRTDETPRLD